MLQYLESSLSPAPNTLWISITIIVSKQRETTQPTQCNSRNLKQLKA